MTLKGITRTCYGTVFNDEEEIHKMSIIYDKVGSSTYKFMWNMLVVDNIEFEHWVLGVSVLQGCNLWA